MMRSCGSMSRSSPGSTISARGWNGSSDASTTERLRQPRAGSSESETTHAVLVEAEVVSELVAHDAAHLLREQALVVAEPSPTLRGAYRDLLERVLGDRPPRWVEQPDSWPLRTRSPSWKCTDWIAPATRGRTSTVSTASKRPE